MPSDWDDKTVRVPSPHAKVAPAQDAFSLGNLLLSEDRLTTEQIQQAVAMQQEHPGIKIGEALVKLGFVEEATVQQVCEDQRVLRTHKLTPQRSALVARVAERAVTQASRLDAAMDTFAGMIDRIAQKLDK